MIFVVLGTQKFQLNRLLQTLDTYVEQGILDGTELYAQTGHSDYKPCHFAYEPLMDKARFDEMIHKADLVIAHSGVGTIITCVNAKRPVIVYPRMKKYGEHVDDHQLDIARAFEKKNYVSCCYEKDSLEEKIKECKTRTFGTYHSQREKIVQLIENFIETEVRER